MLRIVSVLVLSSALVACDPAPAPRPEPTRPPPGLSMALPRASHTATALADDLASAPEGCRRFFAALFAAPPEVGTVRALAQVMGVLPTTLMSRFFRARLPAPKRYLAMARLVYAARLLETPRNPLVTGELAASRAGAPTVILYGHYDVQSAEPLGEWTSPPYAPEVRDGRLYARGAADDKGNFLPLLHVACELARAGDLPLNVRFLIEGEEEVGSRSVLERLAAGFELGHGFGDNHGWLYPLLWSYGGREVDKDGKTVLIDSDETAKAVYRRLVANTGSGKKAIVGVARRLGVLL